VITGLEIIGVAIILLGVIKTLIIFGRCFIKRIPIHSLMTEIRIELSNYLILSLEVFIGRDIIETLLDPTLNDIIILVVLVLLRTLLAFFLNYEITHMPRKQLHKIIEEKSKKV
jgi:uncharacterized membrane protein